MTYSIRVNLLKWLIAPLLIINVVGAGLTYWLAWSPAQIAFDQSLADTAWALIPRLSEIRGVVLVDLPEQAEQVLRVNHFDVIYFTVRNSEGKTLIGDNDFPPLFPPDGLNEPASYDGTMRGESVRITALKSIVGKVTVNIGVAETLRKRTHSQSEILVLLLLLEGLFTFFSIAIVWFGVSKGLLPINQMQADLYSRKNNDLSPVKETNVPSELRPVIGAINDLLNKVRLGANAQQIFLANIAHQLRTPLAGIKMHLELIQQRHEFDSETSHSAKLILSSTERIIRKSNQLLALARSDPSQFEKARLEIVELDKLVEEAIQHFVEEANKKSIDLGFNLQPTKVMGDRFLLRDLIDNLIDNAIRYSPDKRTVTINCFQDAQFGILSVEDFGPGIPVADKDLIFDRFYRINDTMAGSGLGLAIVRDIVKDHGGVIVVTENSCGLGTIFSVRFPPLESSPDISESTPVNTVQL